MTGLLPLRWRHVRWVLAAAALPVIWACTSPPLSPPNPAPERTQNQVFQAAVNRDIDIVFMIDNSLSMMPLQDKLAANFPIFMNTLSSLPGGLPNVNIGVVSSSLGAGPMANVANCPLGGDQGQFQSAPQGNCMTGLAAGQHFLSSIGGMKNFTGDIATAFSCMAKLGDQGCGFEHQFASVLQALEPGPNFPATNADFLRPNAFLSIILITNEDDCSAPPDTDLFVPTGSATDPMGLMSQLGPQASYRCNEFGHLCNGQKPPRTPAVQTNCTSAEDGRLLKVADVVARTKALKNNDMSKIIVAAVTGAPTPYEVIIPDNSDPSYTAGIPNIKHSCVAKDGTYADPSVRIKQWVDAFKGTFVSICDDTFEPALKQIADAIGQAIGPQCVTGQLVDSDLTTAGVQPDCTVTDVTTNAQGAEVQTAVANCAKNGGTMPCWDAVPNDTSCPGKTLIDVKRADKPSNLKTDVACAVCIDGVTNPGCK
ncbi:MAG TPA: hypothetical protein VH374_03245 [Polyangia bacterium]|jgi:hypothetical protein|nr:hypothetical protein [Polyangia bacterium]